MISLCPYCNSLKSAREDNHFCSQKVDLSSSIGNNAFYALTNQLQSGPHRSRLTIRYVSQGYQYYQVDGAEHLLSSDRYLMVDEGQNFNSEIKSEQAVELLIIAFRSQFIEECLEQRKIQLDLPILPGLDFDRERMFFESTYPLQAPLIELLHQVKTAIQTEDKRFFETDDIFVAIAGALLNAHQRILYQIDELQVTKSATKLDLYQRISLAKDYMDVHFGKSLSLSEISQIAAMSTYHFLRTFKHFYGMTPHQYLTQTRMNYAQYLLQYSGQSVAQIATECGFENHSAFGRVFKKIKGQSPLQIKRTRKH